MLASLITNAIIYYNTALLSKVYEQKHAVRDQKAMELIQRISPIAWQHVNLFGTFEFSSALSKVDLDALAAHYATPIRRFGAEPCKNSNKLRWADFTFSGDGQK